MHTSTNLYKYIAKNKATFLLMYLGQKRCIKKILVSKDAALWQLLISLLFSDWCMGCETRDYLKYDAADANFMRRELKFTLLQNLMSRKKSKAPQTDCASSFFFFLSFTWRHPRPECELQHPYSHFVYLLPLSVLLHLIWWREHFEAWGGGIGVTVRFPREAVCLDPLVKPLLAAFVLKKKIVFVHVSRVNYTTNT